MPSVLSFIIMLFSCSVYQKYNFSFTVICKIIQVIVKVIVTNNYLYICHQVAKVIILLPGTMCQVLFQKYEERTDETEKWKRCAWEMLWKSALNISPPQSQDVLPTPAHVPLGHCDSQQCKKYFKALEDECQALRT